MSYVVTTNPDEGARLLIGAQPFQLPAYPADREPYFRAYEDAGNRQRILVTPDQAVWREYLGRQGGEPAVYNLMMLRPPLIVASWRGTTVSTHQHGNITEAEYNDAINTMYPMDWQGWTFAYPELYTTVYAMQYRYYFTVTTENNGPSYRVALATRRFKNESLGLVLWFS